MRTVAGLIVRCLVLCLVLSSCAQYGGDGGKKRYRPFRSLKGSCDALVISVPEQRLYAFDDDGFKLSSYPVSTSKFGLGDKPNSYQTPLGKMKVAAKHGHGAKPGTVFKYCLPTREVVPPNAPGRDPIVTRILRLRGLEKQNAKAYARRVYVHGTPEERNLGHPVSYGCIRMGSEDIIELFDQTSVGCRVEITNERVGRAGDRLGQLFEPIGKVIPGFGKVVDQTGNRLNRIVDPVDKLVSPVGKVLDGVDRGVLVPVDKLAKRVTRPDPKQGTTAETSEEAKE